MDKDAQSHAQRLVPLHHKQGNLQKKANEVLLRDRSRNSSGHQSCQSKRDPNCLLLRHLHKDIPNIRKSPLGAGSLAC